MNLPINLILVNNTGSSDGIKWLFAEFYPKAQNENIDNFINAISGPQRDVIVWFSPEQFNSLKKNKNTFGEFIKKVPKFTAILKKAGIYEIKDEEFNYLISHIKIENSDFNNNAMQSIINSVSKEELDEISNITIDDTDNTFKDISILSNAIDSISTEEFENILKSTYEE